MMTTVINFIQRAILQGTPLLYGATGEIITEESGNLNLGIPGIMYIGGICGIIGGHLYDRSTANPKFCAVHYNTPFKLSYRFCAYGVDLQLSYSYPARQSECYGPCTHDLRRRFR